MLKRSIKIRLSYFLVLEISKIEPEVMLIQILVIKLPLKMALVFGQSFLYSGAGLWSCLNIILITGCYLTICT